MAAHSCPRAPEGGQGVVIQCGQRATRSGVRGRGAEYRGLVVLQLLGLGQILRAENDRRGQTDQHLGPLPAGATALR